MDKKRFFGSGGDLFLFNERSLMVVAAVVSLLLQIISFFTTLDGAKAYFAATFAYAPLLFALAVQSVVYFLENGLRRRVTFGKVTALALAICCSSYFSFVGIYNSVNPPSQYLERAYNGYAKELTALRESVLDSGSDEYASAVDGGVNRLISEYAMLSSEKQTLTSLQAELDSTESELVYGMAEPYIWQYATYEEYAAAYALYISSLTQSSSTEQQAKTQAVLEKYGISDASQIGERTAELTASLSLIEGTFAPFDGDDIYSRIEAARMLAKSGSEDTAAKIAALYNTVCASELVVPDFVSAADIELSLPPYSDIAAGDADAVVRERLTSTIAAACDTLAAAGIEVNAEDYTFENIYTLPIYAVKSGSFGADAAVSLVLAVLVDTLSLLFAMIFVQGRSVLSAADTKQAAISDPMLFERNIVTAVKLGMIAEGTPLSEEADLSEIIDRLGRFVSRFQAVDHAADRGYTMAAARDALGGYEPLISFLCQFGLAKLLTSEEMTLLCGFEAGEAVLLKTKFLLWLSERSKPEANSKRGRTEKAVTA